MQAFSRLDRLGGGRRRRRESGFAQRGGALVQRDQGHGASRAVVIDHIRHLADKADNETHRMGRITWALKVIAKRLNCAVVAAAQLSRGVEGQGDKRPDLKDLRDSGEIEENADNVVGLYREKYYSPESNDITAELLIRKCREGQRNAVIKMGFVEQTMAFVPLARPEYSR